MKVEHDYSAMSAPPGKQCGYTVAQNPYVTTDVDTKARSEIEHILAMVDSAGGSLAHALSRIERSADRLIGTPKETSGAMIGDGPSAPEPSPHLAALYLRAGKLQRQADRAQALADRLAAAI